MEIRQLMYAAAVADRASFTKAAADSYVVQSALSQQVRKLEEELDVRLFDRTTRSVALTPDGALLLPVIREAIEAVQRVASVAEQLHGALRGKVTIGLMEVPPSSLRIADLVSEFHTTHPGVEVSVTSGGSTHLLELVRRGGADCAIVGVPEGPSDERLIQRVSVTERLVAVVSRAHPLATSGAVEPGVLATQAFVDFPPGYGLRHEVDRLLQQFTRRVAFEVSRVEQVVDFVSQDLAVAVLPESVARDWAAKAELAILEIAGEATVRRVALVHPGDRTGSAAAAAFIAMAERRLRPGE